MKGRQAVRSPAATMIGRCGVLHRAVPSLLRTVYCPRHIAGPSARRFAVITNFTNPETPQKPQKDASQHTASFASAAGLAAGTPVPYTQLSVGERSIPCRAVPKPSRGGSAGDLATQAAATKPSVTAQRLLAEGSN